MDADFVYEFLSFNGGFALLLLLLCVLCITCFRRTYSYWKFVKIIRKIPGPPPHPLWGNMDKYPPTEMGIKNWYSYMLNNPHQRVKLLSIGPFIYFIRFEFPEEIGELLCMKHTELPKDELMYGILRPYLGDGLLISNFDKWLTRRKMLTPGFHYDVLKAYISLYNDIVEVFIRKCEKKLEKGEDVISVFENMTLLSLDVILQCACSYESGCQTESREDEYVTAVRTSTDLIFKQVIFLPYSIKPIFYLSPDGAAWRKNCRIVKKKSLQVVESRRKYLIENPNLFATTPYKDFIDILLTSKDGSGKGLSDEGIVEELTTFLFRGHDTTASAMSWTIHILGLHPKYQTMCREEIRSILKTHNSDRIANEDLSKLSFLSMCIKESMRLYLPVNDIYRNTTEDMHINGYLIPKGASLNISIGSLHRNPHVWENSLEFNPFRFDCELPGGHPFAYIPFSGGHRNCIGQKFAFNEMLVSLSRIIAKFEIESLTKEVNRIPVVILKPEEELKIRLKLAK